MKDFAGDCTADIARLLRTVSAFSTGSRVFVATDDADLAKQVQIGISIPYAGVLYGGLQTSYGADPSRAGRAADVRVGVLYAFASRAIGNADSKADAWASLTAGRAAILGQRSPTGHAWRFVSENYLGAGKPDAVYYVQQWSTFAPLIA